MHDLEKKLAKLLEDARKLPPGQERHELLKEIGRFRLKLDALKKRKKSRPTKRPPQLAASFISSRASLIPCQLPTSPMRVFPVRVEHALDVPVQRSRPILRANQTC